LTSFGFYMFVVESRNEYFLDDGASKFRRDEAEASRKGNLALTRDSEESAKPKARSSASQILHITTCPLHITYTLALAAAEFTMVSKYNESNLEALGRS
jgi:hypothetical protein